MKAVLQRVSSASVTVDGQRVGEIGHGLLILLGVQNGDRDEDSVYLAGKTVDLRIFEDEQGKMNKSLLETAGQALIVSQFTLFADWRKGRRPGFTRAASPAEGNRLYEHFVDQVRSRGVTVGTGVFGAHMEVALVNNGPVTLILDTNELDQPK